MGGAADRFDTLDDRLDLLGGRSLLHHDHHLLSSLRLSRWKSYVSRELPV
jgi:hypothetical protein